MRTNARNTDPETSWLAAEQIESSGTAKHQREIALKAISKYPDLTSHELAKITSLDHYMLSRRLPELTELVQGDKRKKRVCTVSGRMCVVWSFRNEAFQ